VAFDHKLQIMLLGCIHLYCMLFYEFSLASQFLIPKQVLMSAAYRKGPLYLVCVKEKATCWALIPVINIATDWMQARVMIIN